MHFRDADHAVEGARSRYTIESRLLILPGNTVTDDTMAVEVRGILRGDSDRIQRVRGAIESVVRAFAFAETGEREELVEEALARLLVNLSAGRFRGESSLATYARNVAKYTCLEHLRRRRLEEAIDFDQVASGARW